MYVFLVILFSVKNCREHATIHLLHFSISWDGFGNGMKTFLPDSSTSLRTVPTIVIADTFCASPDTRISYCQCLLIQGSFCSV